MASPLLALIGLLALVSIVENRASGSGTLVVIEDASQTGFSGNVCYQVIRDRDGVTISEGCFSIAATIAAPEGFQTGERYSIVISLADAECILLDDPRTGNGATPFKVRVSCDAADMAATELAGEATGTPTVWPPVYDEPTVTAIGIGSGDAPAPMASPIPMTDVGND